MSVDATYAHCPHCGELAPQKVVRQEGERPLLWCDLCHRVTITEHDLSLPIDPLLFSPVLSVQIAELDADHERLIETLNELHAAAKVGDRDRLAVASKRLFRDIDRHFEREEMLLEALEFSELEEHRGQHAALFHEMRHLVDELTAVPPHAVADVVLAVKFCLIEHLREDMKYKDHLAAAIAARGL